MSVTELLLRERGATYLPARLVYLKNGTWEISWWQTDPIDNKRKRSRKTFDINRIRDKRERLKVARAKIKEINELLPYGWPYNLDFELKKAESMTIIEAIDKGWSYKKKVLRRESISSYTSRINHLKEYLRKKRLETIKIEDFDKAKAFMYMDSITGIANSTYNNYLLYIHGIFEELKKREEIDKNPFSGIPKKKETEKKRVGLSNYQAKTIFLEIYEEDKRLFLAVILLRYCFIRPNEMRKLRKADFDLKRGCIYISGKQAKNDKSAVVTIPQSLISVLKNYQLDQGNQSELVFCSAKDPYKAIGKNAFNARHREILQQLQEKKLLDNINGISFYSWKDTGGLELIESGADILDIMTHMRHQDITTTQRYIKKRAQLIEKIKGMQVELPE